MSASVELYPSWLLRAADGDRAIEAAVVLLCETDLLRAVHHCVVVDAANGHAWLDWAAVIQHAERLPNDERATTLAAAAIATELRTALHTERRAVGLALNHLLA